MVQGSNPGGGEIFRTRPDQPWGPPIFLCSGYGVSFIGLKQLGFGIDQPAPSSVEAKERVGLYLYSSTWSSWPVIGWIFFFGANFYSKTRPNISFCYVFWWVVILFYLCCCLLREEKSSIRNAVFDFPAVYVGFCVRQGISRLAEQPATCLADLCLTQFILLCKICFTIVLSF